MGFSLAGKKILGTTWNKALPCIKPNMGIAEFRTLDIQTVANHFTVPSTPICGAAKQTSCLQKKVLILNKLLVFALRKPSLPVCTGNQ